MSLTSSSVHIKNCFSRSIFGTISVGNRRCCNCVQCGDEGEGAISCRPPKCVFSQWWVHNWYNNGNLKRKIMVQIHFLQLSTRISSFYPNIKALVTILCTIPVSSCTAERSFGGLKRIKTGLRSSMSNKRLSSLTLLHIHLDRPIDIEEVIDEFSRHPGEFNFLIPLNSYLFIVLLHFFLLTLHKHINNESLWSNLVKVHLDCITSHNHKEDIYKSHHIAGIDIRLPSTFEHHYW